MKRFCNYVESFFIIFFLYTTLYAQYPDIECKHFIDGYPAGAPATNDLIKREIYALSNNGSTKFADWVCYRLDKSEINGPSITERNWKADPLLKPSRTLEPPDYKDAYKIYKYDRGHQAPLANFKGTIYADETNYLSNITPQKATLNRGLWKKLEDMERDLVKRYDSIYVMTGPLYETYMPDLPAADEPHKVPSGYWKIIVIPLKTGLEVFGFIFDQYTPSTDLLKNHLVNINEIQMRTNLDFFWKLDDTKEKKLEEKPNSKYNIFFGP
ncbi:MAG: DNA/RNA non-specific endonuclease [Candidatus Kapabacteria bacterium]|jgi:endonuclease G|nr:DNA/RNA non-specific endonuclease [Candidatus Kapabacteria bacterium]